MPKVDPYEWYEEESENVQRFQKIKKKKTFDDDITKKIKFTQNNK